MKAGTVHGQGAIPAGGDPSEAGDPANGALDFPPFSIPPQRSAILELWLLTVAPVRCNQFNALPGQQFPQGLTVIGFVANQPLHHRRVGQGRQRIFNQGYFRRCGRTKVASERNTLAVCHHHKLCTLSAFGFADPGPPFFAGAKVPSMKVSSQSIKPC